MGQMPIFRQWTNAVPMDGLLPGVGAVGPGDVLCRVLHEHRLRLFVAEAIGLAANGFIDGAIGRVFLAEGEAHGAEIVIFAGEGCCRKSEKERSRKDQLFHAQGSVRRASLTPYRTVPPKDSTQMRQRPAPAPAAAAVGAARSRTRDWTGKGFGPIPKVDWPCDCRHRQSAMGKCHWSPGRASWRGHAG